MTKLDESIAEALAAGQRIRPSRSEKTAAVAAEPSSRSEALAKLAEALRDHEPPVLTLDVLSRVNQRLRRG